MGVRSIRGSQDLSNSTAVCCASIPSRFGAWCPAPMANMWIPVTILSSASKRAGEIWAYGFRSPWRLSWDSQEQVAWWGCVGKRR